jgi:hypothetical protein
VNARGLGVGAPAEVGGGLELACTRDGCGWGWAAGGTMARRGLHVLGEQMAQGLAESRSSSLGRLLGGLRSEKLW